MKFLLPVAIFFLALFLISCGNTKQLTGSSDNTVLDPWIGHTREELLKVYGRPVKQTSDGNGGEIITFDTSIIHPKTTGVNYNNGNRGLSTYATDNYVVTKSKLFYINPKAIIYRTRSEERQGY